MPGTGFSNGLVTPRKLWRVCQLVGSQVSGLPTGMKPRRPLRPVSYKVTISIES